MTPHKRSRDPIPGQIGHAATASYGRSVHLTPVAVTRELEY